VFKGGIGKRGKAGLLGRARDLKTALAEKERLLFVEHAVGNLKAKANGVTLEAGVSAKHEVYFSISDSTRFRAPTMTLSHCGGLDIEDVDKRHIAQVPFDPLTGLKAFVVANALSEIGAPKETISPLVQQLPKLWELFHYFGMTTLELNPIRMREDSKGRLTRSPAISSAGSTATIHGGSGWGCPRTYSQRTTRTSNRRSTNCALTRVIAMST
jgi:succinyl-CoA synthetase beta subunit